MSLAYLLCATLLLAVCATTQASEVVSELQGKLAAKAAEVALPQTTGGDESILLETSVQAAAQFGLSRPSFNTAGLPDEIKSQSACAKWWNGTKGPNTLGAKGSGEYWRGKDMERQQNNHGQFPSGWVFFYKAGCNIVPTQKHARYGIHAPYYTDVCGCYENHCKLSGYTIVGPCHTATQIFGCFNKHGTSDLGWKGTECGWQVIGI